MRVPHGVHLPSKALEALPTCIRLEGRCVDYSEAEKVRMSANVRKTFSLTTNNNYISSVQFLSSETDFAAWVSG